MMSKDIGIEELYEIHKIKTDQLENDWFEVATERDTLKLRVEELEAAFKTSRKGVDG